MKTNNNGLLLDDIKKLVNESVFMPSKLRAKLSKKLASPAISRENLLKMKSVLQNIVNTENSAIRQVLDKDPMFFKNLKRRFAREKLAKKLSVEMQMHADEMANIEEELHNLLTA